MIYNKLLGLSAVVTVGRIMKLRNRKEKKLKAPDPNYPAVHNCMKQYINHKI
jgi:hypothetical protein